MNFGGDCALFPPQTIGGQTYTSEEMKARAFSIMDTNVQCTGYSKNRDPNTGANASDQLRYVPTHFNVYDPNATVQTQILRSIRVGHACGRNSSSSDNSSALYYYMYVTPQNAMLYLYYAFVCESPNATSGHGADEDPSVMIRVRRRNENGQWVKASPTGYYPTTQVDDTLAYYITATPGTNGLANGQNGWTYYPNTRGSGYSNPAHVWWKQWTKVPINLSSLMYTQVRIELMVATCTMTQHYSYAYIAGECRPMAINSSGCPAGMDTNVTTLTAPRGVNHYKWYASRHGAAATDDAFFKNNSILESAKYFKWRAIEGAEGTEQDSAFVYRVRSSDFAVDLRPNPQHNPDIEASEDSVGNKQAFRCEMTSAIDPGKPFKSSLYVNVQNTKPTMEIDSLSICGGDVQLRNRSYVPGDGNLVRLDSTVWSFYRNPTCQGDPDTLINGGENLSIHFDGSDIHYAKVRTNINEELVNTNPPLEHNACYSEQIYPIRPLPKPVGGFTISPNSRVLCADNPLATLHDTTNNSTYRVWRFLAADSTMTDTVVGEGEQNRTFGSHIFSRAKEPIELTVRNGLYYLNPVDQSQKIWCENTIHDSVMVFKNPKLTVTGERVVCKGQTTNADVSVDMTELVGADSVSYEWSRVLGTVTPGMPTGSHLAVTPYADTSVYYVKVTSHPQGCVAWDSAFAYLVTPKLTRITPPGPPEGHICPGDSVVLTGTNAHHYSWRSSPEDPTLLLFDTSNSDRVVVYPKVNTTYTLIGHGDNNCSADPLSTDVTVHPRPVPTIHLNPGAIDSEDPTITLTDVSPNSVSSVWTFAGGEMVAGRDVTHTFEESTGADSVYVTLTNYNDIGCDTVYPFSIPVTLYTAWLPNVFTPGSEDANARFRLYTINAYEHFHIYIYNRFGQLVFESADPNFEWDGSMEDGTLCPQGAYTYVCRFRKPGANTLASMRGTITLVR